jgi:hypothetical protein
MSAKNKPISEKNFAYLVTTVIFFILAYIIKLPQDEASSINSSFVFNPFLQKVFLSADIIPTFLLITFCGCSTYIFYQLILPRHSTKFILALSRSLFIFTIFFGIGLVSLLLFSVYFTFTGVLFDMVNNPLSIGASIGSVIFLAGSLIIVWIASFQVGPFKQKEKVIIGIE